MNQGALSGPPCTHRDGHVLCRTSRQPDGVGAAAQRLSYPIQTREGAIGHVIDCIMDDKSWAICHLVVETGHWYSGKEIVISPKPYRPDQLRGIQGIRERDQGSHSGSTAMPCFSARLGTPVRDIWSSAARLNASGAVPDRPGD